MIILRKQPLLLAFIYLFIAFQVHIRLLKPVIIPRPLNFYLFLILTGAGVGLMLAAIKLFQQSETTHKFEEAPTEASTPAVLVTKGVYGFSRNPMYAAIVLILAGISAWFATPWVFIAPVAFFITARYFFIPKEEQLLEALFGEVYTAYQRHVRRWL